MNLFLRVFKKYKRYIQIYIITFILSLLFNFAIDSVFYGNEIVAHLDIYLFRNFKTLGLMLFLYIYVVKILNADYWQDRKKVRVLCELVILILSSLIFVVVLLILSPNYKDLEIREYVLRLLTKKKIIILIFIENSFIIILLESIFSLYKQYDNKLRLQKTIQENERFKYNQLKNQINPHFLFNSLNLISAMTYNPENEKGTIYIDKLADIYRYVLQNNEKNLIQLSLEIEFIHKYIDILKIRIYDGLDVNIDLDDDILNREVLPMSLQLLIENVVKHNIADAETPLHVNIFSDGEYVIVSNNINPKEGNISSMGIGLENLNQRYKLISGKEIVVINENNCFIVKIPLI